MSTPIEETVPAPPAPAGLLYRLGPYTWQWLIGVAVLGALQPVIQPVGSSDADWFWHEMLRVLVYSSVPVALVCALIFTLFQNTLNKRRSKGRSWGIVLASWVLSRLLVGGTYYLLSAN